MAEIKVAVLFRGSVFELLDEFTSDALEQSKMNSYILAPTGLKLFQEIYVYNNSFSNKDQEDYIKLLQPGDFSILENFESGDFIHNVESYPNQSPVFARSAGTFCQVRSLTQSIDSNTSIGDSVIRYAKVRLPSGSHRLISLQAGATLGSVNVYSSLGKNLLKAGRSR